MTELKFLLKLVFEHELDAEAKKLCIERIGDLEEMLSQSMSKPIIHSPKQSVNVSPMAPAIPPANIANLGEVSTGNGLRGPNKMRGHL